MKYCGGRFNQGHGECDICGKPGWGGIYQCDGCKLADAKVAWGGHLPSGAPEELHPLIDELEAASRALGGSMTPENAKRVIEARAALDRALYGYARTGYGKVNQ